MIEKEGDSLNESYCATKEDIWYNKNFSYICLFMGWELYNQQASTQLFIKWDRDTPIRLLIRRVVLSGIQISIFVMWMKFVEKKTFYEITVKNRMHISTMVIGFFIGCGTVTVIIICLCMSHAIQLEINKVNLSFFQLIVSIILVVIGWLLQSGAEEIALRGWLIPRIIGKSTVLIAIVSTSMVFGILHLFTSGVTMLSFLNLVLSGAFFALYAIKQKCLWGVWGCHFGWNLSLGNIYGLSISGFNPLGPTVLKTRMQGSNVLTGGLFGVEASILTTVFLLIGVCILSYKMYRQKTKGGGQE